MLLRVEYPRPRHQCPQFLKASHSHIGRISKYPCFSTGRCNSQDMAGNLFIYIERIRVTIIGVDLSVGGFKDDFAYGILAIVFCGILNRFHFKLFDSLLMAKIKDAGIETRNLFP